jgi:hypothetical protein
VIRRLRGRLLSLAWAIAALPGLGQLVLVAVAVVGRVGYPYDLEWMEGGMLAHVARIAEGAGLYRAPSVEFIPFLYTPLYPGLLAALAPVFGVGYGVARGLSVLALLATVLLGAVAVAGSTDRAHRGPAWCGAVLAGGFFAAGYPWFDGWYDIARADTLFVAMVVGGLVAVVGCAQRGTGWRGQAGVGAAAALLALGFFCKQTGVLYVAAGGAIVLALNWRRVPVYVAVAGAIGLGGTWLLNRSSEGWFWTYVFEVHQAHDCNAQRFWRSFSNILGQFPAMTAMVTVGLLAVAAVRITTGTTPRASRPLLVWSWVFAVSCVAGAVGWATQWAHFNAYMPALLFGALAAGSSLAALHGCVLAVRDQPLLADLVCLAAALTMGAQLITAWWDPGQFVPKDDDRRAGARLIDTVRAIDGDVLIPFHPWYGHLAGKKTWVHRMGVMDVSYVNPPRPAAQRCFWAPSQSPRNPPPWPIVGLAEHLRGGRFAAIIWDDRPIQHFPGLEQAYRYDRVIERDARPRLYTGARVTPKQVWVPAVPVAPPPGARVLWSFEDGTLVGWRAQGSAWGAAPRARKLPGQGDVRGYQGRYWLSSMHGGDSATGTLTSPEFALAGDRLSFLVSGGRDAERLRVELHVAGQVVAHATSSPPSEQMAQVVWDVARYRDQNARIVLRDASTGSWGHLNVDEFWLWAGPAQSSASRAAGRE